MSKSKLELVESVDISQRKNDLQESLKRIHINVKEVQLVDIFHATAINEELIAKIDSLPSKIEKEGAGNRSLEIANSLVMMVNSFKKPEVLAKAYKDCLELCDSLKERFPNTTAVLCFIGGELIGLSIATFFVLAMSLLTGLPLALAGLGAAAGIMLGMLAIFKAIRGNTDLRTSYLQVADRLQSNLSICGMFKSKDNQATEESGLSKADSYSDLINSGHVGQDESGSPSYGEQQKAVERYDGDLFVLGGGPE